MFYSHQLLSKKGPLGQIWIAATINAKITRRKAAQIDIAEICEQILNPAVPLALRLSGILMGGIVLVFDRKVKFFSDDVNKLLGQIKALTATKKEDSTMLPKGKLQARFEAITINYGFEDFDNIERLMLQPGTPGKEAFTPEEFFIIPDPLETSPGKNPFQAQHEDITLQEDIVGIEVPYRQDNDERMPTLDATTLEKLSPEFNFQEEMPTLQDGLLNAVPDHHPAPEEETKMHDPEVAEGPKSPELEAPPQQRKRRNRRKVKKNILVDEDFTEVPAIIFHSWLQNPSDIMNGEGKRKIVKIADEAIVQHLLYLPSSSLCWNPVTGVESSWSHSLLELWDVTINCCKRNREESEDNGEQLLRKTRRRSSVNYEEANPDRNFQTLVGGEEPAADMPTDFNLLPDFLPPELDIQVDPEMKEYGSIERLRSALDQLPNTGSEEDYLMINQLGFTPGQSGRRGMSRSGRVLATPGSDKELQMEKEGDLLPPSGSRRSSSSQKAGFDQQYMTPGGDDNISLPEAVTPQLGVIQNTDHNSHLKPLITTLSQFELEETGPGPSQKLSPRRSMNKITASMLQFLHQQFRDLHTSTSSSLLSCFSLSEGLNKPQAARLFYQICVLASNAFITVEQKEAYGDILLGKGLII